MLQLSRPSQSSIDDGLLYTYVLTVLLQHCAKGRVSKEWRQHVCRYYAKKLYIQSHTQHISSTQVTCDSTEMDQLYFDDSIVS